MLNWDIEIISAETISAGQATTVVTDVPAETLAEACLKAASKKGYFWVGSSCEDPEDFQAFDRIIMSIALPVDLSVNLSEQIHQHLVGKTMHNSPSEKLLHTLASIVRLVDGFKPLGLVTLREYKEPTREKY